MDFLRSVVSRKIKAKQFLFLVLELVKLLHTSDLIISHLFKFASAFFIGKRSIYRNLFDLRTDLTKDSFTFTDTLFKNTDTQQTALINIRINGVIRDYVVDIYNLTLLSATVNSTNSLLNTHRVPRKIIVDHHIAELIVKTFRANLGKEQNINGIFIFLGQLKLLTKLVTRIVLHATINLLHAQSFGTQFLLQICKSMTEGTEQNDFIIFSGLLFLDDFKHAIEFGIFLRKRVCQFKHVACHCRKSRNIVVAQLCIIYIVFRVGFKLHQASFKNITHIRSKTENTACRLSAYSAHHKRHRAYVVKR